MTDDNNLAESIAEFESILQIKSNFENEFLGKIRPIFDFIFSRPTFSKEERRLFFIGKINYKFRLNSSFIANFFYQSAVKGVTFNFHQKRAIQCAFDNGDKKGFIKYLKSMNLELNIIRFLSEFFNCVTESETILHIQEECKHPKKLRKDSGKRDVQSDILKSLFTSFIWSYLPEKQYHLFFNEKLHRDVYDESFWSQLRKYNPTLYERDNALEICHVDLNKYESTAISKSINDFIINAYYRLNNFGFLAIIFTTDEFKTEKTWEIIEKSIFYAEKFIERPIENSFFRSEEIKRITKSYIPNLDLNKANFSLGNEGFTYKDTYILSNVEKIGQSILVIFQKNQRDETLIPCPSCRSNDVQGNSYSSLGVKSWECKNQLCFDKSKYNRGKRYSFKGLLMQAAIDDDSNLIKKDFLKKWKRDVVVIKSILEATEFLIECYSMNGDVVKIYDLAFPNSDYKGRKVKLENFPYKNDDWLDSRDCSSLFIFNRLNIDKANVIPGFERKECLDNQTLILGDSGRVLRTFPDGFFDGAVTSPPYYNAKEYSQWPNIYCYIHDIRDVANEIFRTLKDGSYLLYNIFNYFDNENSITFSAMGQKRIILSSFITIVFCHLGFELVGNIVWDKGEIEGKRGYNSGNFSPFYQAPFNCWEHILIFKKPGLNDAYKKISKANLSSKILKSKPVFKIVNGVNKYGHSAPFPVSIPNLLLENLTPRSTVLDPYAGSMTTARAAVLHNCNSFCIEKNNEFYQLGKGMISSSSSEQTQPSLFI